MEEQATTTTRVATPAPQQWAFESRTVEEFIDHLVALVYEMGLNDRIEQAQPARWKIGTDLADYDPMLTRVGFIYMLDAIVRTPDIHLYFFNRLRQALLMIGQGTGLEEIAPPIDVDYIRYVAGMPKPIEASDRRTTQAEEPLEERAAA